MAWAHRLADPNRRGTFVVTHVRTPPELRDGAGFRHANLTNHEGPRQMEVSSSTEISSQVLSLVENAKQFLLLVTPYFDPWPRLTSELIRAANRPGMQVVLLLRGGEDQAKQAEKAKELSKAGVRVEFLSRLHAKVYISESAAIVTSMNLLKSSALDSWELALRADREKDAVVYTDILKHTRGLVKRALDDAELAPKLKANSELDALTSMLQGTGRTPAATMPAASPAVLAPKGAPPRARSKAGHCIRCGNTIAFKLDKPFCPDCFKAWAKYEKPDYKENHCHDCGKERATSMAKPVCRPCWDASA